MFPNEKAVAASFLSDAATGSGAAIVGVSVDWPLLLHCSVPKENPDGPLVPLAAVATAASFVPANINTPKEDPGAELSLTPLMSLAVVFRPTSSSSAPPSKKEGNEGCNPFVFYVDGPGVLWEVS